jgi:hypothetical protein
MLKWHRRARKTTLAVLCLIDACLRGKNEVFCYVGPTYTQAKSIIWRDPNMLFRYLPSTGWTKNEQELSVHFAQQNTTLVIKGGEDPDAVRGIDAAGVVFDEWPLMKEEVWTAIFRPIVAQDPKRWAMFLFTPNGETHATKLWRNAQEWDDWETSTLKASESGLLSRDELDKARREMPGWLYDQEFECADITDEDQVLITSRMLDNLRGHTRSMDDQRRIISVDVGASYGGDRTVIGAFKGPKIDPPAQKLRERDTMRITGLVATTMGIERTDMVVVDEIGVGKGVADRLSEIGKQVIAFNSAERSTEPERFGNKRAEMYWYAMEEIQARKVDYPEDIELRQELCAVRVATATSRGKIMLELKSKTKERLGRSPDSADMYCMGRWALQFVPHPEEEAAWHFGETEMAKSYNVRSVL